MSISAFHIVVVIYLALLWLVCIHVIWRLQLPTNAAIAAYLFATSIWFGIAYEVAKIAP